MDHSSHRWCLTLASGLALVLAIVPAAIAEHAWGNYHWERASNPITLELGDNVDPVKWGARLTEAASDWDKSSVLNTPVAAGQAKGKCRPTDGRIEVCTDSYGNTGWLGVAQIWVSGDHILRATAKMNDTYHDNPPYNSYSWKQVVMCQEIGHGFGLGHQNEDFNTDLTNSCMEYASDPAGNESPDSHDYQMLEDIYAHLDGDGGGDGGGGGDDCWPPGKCKNRSGGQAAPPAFDMPLHGPDHWGKLIAHSRGQSLFVQDFGHGFKVFTHVTWTLEMAEELGGHDH